MAVRKKTKKISNTKEKTPANKIALRKTAKPKLSPKEQKILVETREQLQAVLKKYMVTGLEDLRVLRDRKDIAVLDAMLITMILGAVNKGDQSTIDWLLRHCVPPETPPAKHVHITGGLDNTNSVDLSKLDDDELEALMKVYGKGKSVEQS